MNKIEVVLISQVPLPYNKIGSWTNMYNYLLSSNRHCFDHIICPKVLNEAKAINYHALRKVSLKDKLKSKLMTTSSRYENYFEALAEIIKPDVKYILHIIDNSGIVLPIQHFLVENKIRNNFYIQYYYQGHAPLFERKRGHPFLNAIDELFFLTHLSYKEYLNYYDDCTFKSRVISNATNSQKFKKINKETKRDHRNTFNINQNDFVFIWCSQDRPKKGLHIVLEAFRQVYEANNNVVLLVVGIDRQIDQKGVKVVGRLPNDDLPKYYQMSDVFLFPSLWKEGFGIVLAEALKCGCYCIASRQGGIPEVLNYGEFGVLIEHPNFVEEWVNEMNTSIKQFKEKKHNPFLDTIPENIYDIDVWLEKINQSLRDAKTSIHLK